MKMIAITSCPTGIAHTYMAAEALEEAAKAAGHDMVVETQGSAGSDDFPAGAVEAADVIIIAADVDVKGRERFTNMPQVNIGVKKAIDDAAGVVADAERAVRDYVPGTASAGGGGATATPAGATTGGGGGGHVAVVRGWLMTGVSYMIPFVAAGGLMIALAFLVGGYQVTDLSAYEDSSLAALLFTIGGTAFQMLVPILAGFIAYAMADRPGLTPGIVGGLIASEIGAGFLGGLAAGLIAGGIVMAIKKIPIPKFMRSLMPVVIIPLVATFLVGFLMIVVIGKPIAAAQSGMESWLGGLSGSNAIFLGLLLGLMMGFDLGGPVNKVAYTFGIAALASDNYTVMAAVMAAGMTPPLGLALATAVRKRLFTASEQENGKAAWVLGASFISEGAIPFAAADPLRVIPASMAGSAVTGALSMAFGSTLRAPHGGLWVIGLIGQPLLYLLAIAIGTVITAAIVIVLKSMSRVKDEDLAVGIPAGSTVNA